MTTIDSAMPTKIDPTDLAFFTTLAQSGSLTRTAREMGITTPAVSKRLVRMEERLGALLVSRTTRRMSLTPEGELLLDHARRISNQLEQAEAELAGFQAEPQGLVRVNATLGFGRSHIAPLVSKFVARHPKVDVQLQLSVNPPSMADDTWDLCFRFGLPADSRVVARLVAPNRRVVVASPSYLKKHGSPRTPDDLRSHNCIGIRQGDDAYGLWRFRATKGKTTHGKQHPWQGVKVRGNLTTNDGGVAVQWALEGHGVLLRALWDVQRCCDSGRLVPLLTDYDCPEADVYAVYPSARRDSQRVKAFIDFTTSVLAVQG